MEDRILKPTFLFAIICSLPIIILSGVLLFAAPYFPIYSEYFFLAAIIPIILFAYRVLLITSKKYTIENEQLIYKSGVFSITEDFLELYRIKDYRVVRSFPFRLIKVMAIELETSDKTHPKFIISGIKKSSITNDIRALVEENRRARGVREFD